MVRPDHLMSRGLGSGMFHTDRFRFRGVRRPEVLTMRSKWSSVRKLWVRSRVTALMKRMRPRAWPGFEVTNFHLKRRRSSASPGLETRLIVKQADYLLHAARQILPQFVNPESNHTPAEALEL